jgi:formylglycine-generating enzyme required for sulfatase activity/serine/threonine protein kinase
MDLEPGAWVTDKVQLVRPLGQGAMGEVWLASHETLGTEVAVKFISEELGAKREDVLERFTREVTAAAQLKSPNVVQMLDHGITDDGRPYIVMELLVGESLNDRIENGGALSPHDTAQVVLHVARALTLAHKHGVIHRDIKPHNIFIRHIHGELYAKVLDFGIAKEMHRTEELTLPGTIIGTPEYLCRDIIATKKPHYNEQADLWSLCVVAYKCLTSQPPFQGETLALILAALAVGDFVPPTQVRPELPERYDAWFERAFHDDPNERFANAEQLAVSFRELVDPEIVPWDRRETQVRKTVKPATSARGIRKGRLAGIVLGGLAIGVGVVAVVVNQQAAPPAPLPPLTTPVMSASSKPSAAPTIASAAPPASGSAASLDAPDAAVPDVLELRIPAGELWMGCADELVLRADAGNTIDLDEEYPPPAHTDGSGKDATENENSEDADESTPDCGADEFPGRVVFVDAYRIDRTEVTVSDYEACVDVNKCTASGLNGYVLKNGRFGLSDKCNWRHDERPLHPLNCVSHAQAQKFCRWMDKRLPTEAEWERAARGNDRRTFPWGNTRPSCDYTIMANGCGAGNTWPIASKPRDESPFGVRDMAGSVREWVADWYDADYYQQGAARSPTGPPMGMMRSARGGSWGNHVGRFMRVSEREGMSAATRSVHLGFRCARSEPPTE